MLPWSRLPLQHNVHERSTLDSWENSLVEQDYPISWVAENHSSTRSAESLVCGLWWEKAYGQYSPGHDSPAGYEPSTMSTASLPCLQSLKRLKSMCSRICRCTCDNHLWLVLSAILTSVLIDEAPRHLLRKALHGNKSLKVDRETTVRCPPWSRFIPMSGIARFKMANCTAMLACALMWLY